MSNYSEIIDPYTRLTVAQAKLIQIELAGKVKIAGTVEPENVQLIAGVDASISVDKKSMIGVIAILNWPTLDLNHVYVDTLPVSFPYIPGYLSFREIPVLLKVAEQITTRPDLVIVDGQGIAHPRRIGLASHLGLLTGWKTIGCAKSRLIGDCQEPGKNRGSFKKCIYHNERIGSILRTRESVKPVWVSPGTGIDFDSSNEWILRTATKYRLPDPIRAAHNSGSKFRQGFTEKPR